MAKLNSSQLFKDDEQEKVNPTDDELRHLTGISTDEESAMEREAHNGAAEDIGNSGGLFNPSGDSKAASKSQIAGAEGNAGVDTPLGGTSATLAEAKGLYSGGEAARSAILSSFQFNRKKGIGGGIIAVLIVITFFTISIESGPAQAIQLSEILKHSFLKNDSDSSTMTNRLFRYARAAKNGDIAETHLSTLGSSVFGKTMSQLSEIGVEVTRGPTGAPLKVTIDTEKLKTAYPELHGATDAEAKNFIANKISGITADQVTGEGGKFTIDQSHFDLRTARMASVSTVGLLQDGKAVTAFKARFFTEALNLPSILHPLSRAVASATNSKLNGAKLQQQETIDEENNKAKAIDAVTSTGDAAVADVEGKSSGVQAGAVKALTFTAGACFARSISTDIVKVDYARIYLPAATMALRDVAIGSQVQSGKDLTSGILGAYIKSLTDSKGKSIWQAQGLQALAGGHTSGLTDALPDVKQGFSSHSTATSITKYADKSLGGDTSASVLCSGPGQLIQGITTIAIAAVSELGSEGTLTPAIVGAFAAKTSAQFAESAVFMHFLQEFILNKTTAAALAKDAFSGPEGGNLLALGSRGAANMLGLSSGGATLGNAASVLADANQQQQDEQAFRSKSLVARTFDINDYHSLTGQLAQSVSPSWSQNVSSLFSGFTHIGSILPHAFASLLPKASADASYDWGFGQTGLPDAVLNDPDLQDPYANAETLAKNVLDPSCLNGNGTVNSSCGIIDRAQKCFGVTFSHDSNQWDELPGTPPDVNTEEYISANCNPFGDSKNANADKDWARMMVYVASNGDMKAAACQQGDDQSCKDLGFSAQPAANTGSSVTVSGSAAQLAQQLLNSSNFVPVYNGCSTPPNPHDPNTQCGVYQDLQAIAAGKTIQNSDTCGKPVTAADDSNNAALLQVLLTATSKYKVQPINIITGHGCDQFLHPKGRASDIDFVTDLSSGAHTNFTPGSDGDNQALDAQFYLYIASILPKGGELGQSSCPGRSGLPATPNIIYFPDGCNHQHVDLGNLTLTST